MIALRLSICFEIQLYFITENEIIISNHSTIRRGNLHQCHYAQGCPYKHNEVRGDGPFDIYRLSFTTWTFLVWKKTSWIIGVCYSIQNSLFSKWSKVLIKQRIEWRPLRKHPSTSKHLAHLKRSRYNLALTICFAKSDEICTNECYIVIILDNLV